MNLLKRVHWKLRWKVLKSPMVIRNWHSGYRISLPQSGSAAQIYYRKYSEPRLAAWMQDHLESGDTFVDIGAHIGEYGLIAAAAVGPSGTLIALEPQQDLCSVVTKNFTDNRITNFRVVHGALGEHNGFCHLFTDSKNKGAVLDMNSKQAETPMFDLATLLGDDTRTGRVWMKLDAAGYELPCLAACQDYLKRHPIHLILKAYSEHEVSNRFPGISTSLVGFLDSMGYRSFRLAGDVPEPWDGTVQGYCEVILCEPPGHTGVSKVPAS